MKAVQKYLEIYAEPEIHLLASMPSLSWVDTLVIPARRENEHLHKTLQSVERAASFSNRKVLIILVVNGPACDVLENQILLDRLSKEASQVTPGVFFRKGASSDLLIVDRASSNRCFKEKEGVGLARKIGCDMALALISSKRITSPWIRNTDADVILPEDYFLDLEVHGDHRPSGFLYEFTHHSEQLGDLAPALDLYDLSLRYYVSGLRWAGSPYAFHTIGSAMVVHAEAYAEVRGFPKREAGEDFYLLNKLAKIGRIESSLGAPIGIQGRLSDRTPFGTGAKIEEFSLLLADGREISFYNPEIFSHLRDWLLALQRYAYAPHSLEEEVSNSPSGSTLSAVLQHLQALEAIPRLHQRSKSPEIRLRHFHTWFDAFRTLKFVHRLRETSLPSLPWKEAIQGLSELTSDTSLRYKISQPKRSVVH